MTQRRTTRREFPKALTTVWSLLRRATVYELGMWRSLFRWILRRPTGPAGTVSFGYAGVVTPLLIVFIAVSAIEIPVLDLILPWKIARIIAATLGVYGVFWMIGLLASLRVHPHLVAAEGIRLRNGISIDLALPWTAIETVRKRHRSLSSGRTVQVERTDTRAVLNIGVSSQTTVDILLRKPTVLPVPKGTGEPVHELRVYVDDADGFVTLARRHLSAEPPGDAGAPTSESRSGVVRPGSRAGAGDPARSATGRP
ncbi:hypothetical protein [Plantactinospora sp. BB1]|uniref:hypothetical protein n=1 Tax=Plantactinospora sp. BB1 TaxID=2071627 RepID=UPI000D17E0BB|nr:hypothetical protein [Plantactinospora sp. BB1]AVT40241.1 hypothetical protein C6W10_31595 [Plantactinospora sp. BB1]